MSDTWGIQETQPTPYDGWDSGSSEYTNWLMNPGGNGWNSYGLDINSNEGATKLMSRLALGMFPRSISQVAFGNSLEPARQNAIKSYLTMMQPGNLLGTADDYQTKANANAVEQARIADLLGRSLGYTGGETGGQAGAYLADAQSSGNNYLAKLFSPEGQASMLQSLLGILGQGQQVTTINDLLNIAGANAQGESARAQSDAAANAWSGALGSALGGLAGAF